MKKNPTSRTRTFSTTMVSCSVPGTVPIYACHSLTHAHLHTYILPLHVPGVLSDVLNYVLLHAKGTADIGGGEEGDEGSGEAVKSKGLETGFSHSNEAVFVACFSFLKALAKDNIQVQRRCVVISQCQCVASIAEKCSNVQPSPVGESSLLFGTFCSIFRLYDRMDDLLDVDLAVPYIADVLTEVFTGGPELCMKVREEQVEKLFQMVASVEEEEGRAELIMTLQAIAKVRSELDRTERYICGQYIVD